MLWFREEQTTGHVDNIDLIDTTYNTLLTLGSFVEPFIVVFLVCDMNEFDWI